MLLSWNWLRVAVGGTGLVYWQGCDQPGDRAWARASLTAQTCVPLWSGDRRQLPG